MSAREILIKYNLFLLYTHCGLSDAWTFQAFKNAQFTIFKTLHIIVTVFMVSACHLNWPIYLFPDS